METKLSVTAFWDMVEQRLMACSLAELRAIVWTLAQATAPAERQAFLDILQQVVATATVERDEPIPAELLTDIATLTDELQEALAGADDWDEYDAADSPGPYEEFVEPLSILFDRAAMAFAAGDATIARTAYHGLFAALARADGHGRGVRAENLHDIDLGEARARYLRAVYDSESSAQRPAALFDAMRAVRSWLSGPRPMLQDIMQITPQPLPDQEQFCHDWMAFLRTQSGRDANAWLREAVRLSRGTRRSETLARTGRAQRPQAYLDWCAALQAAGQPQAVLAAAQEALRVLPSTLSIRAAVADYLCAAALHLHDTAALREGRWQAFVAQPTLARLLDLWEVTPIGAERTQQLHQAVQLLQHALAQPPEPALHRRDDDVERPARPAKAVLAHAYLLAGDWDAAYQLAAPEQVLGWSSSHNTQGLIVLCCLVQMSGTAPDQLPPNLTQLWHWELQNSTGFVAWHSTDTGEASLLTRLQHAYMQRLPGASWPPGQQVERLAWCLDVVQRRIDAIVHNRHRGSYDKAALLLAACAELLHLLGKAQEASALLDDARQRFPRHRAFQTELQKAVRRMG